MQKNKAPSFPIPTEAAICKGWQEAASVITDYLRQKTEG